MNDEYELDDGGTSYIQISADMRLLMAHRNWQLQKRFVRGEKSKDANKVVWTSFRYYMSLESALNDIIQIKTASEVFKDVKGLIAANKKVVEELKKLFYPKYTISEA
jgi:hypothetical protein